MHNSVKAREEGSSCLHDFCTLSCRTGLTEHCAHVLALSPATPQCRLTLSTTWEPSLGASYVLFFFCCLRPVVPFFEWDTV